MAPSNILDYSCGQGRYIAELHRLFPNAALTGCDVSDVGLRLAQEKNPAATFIRMVDERIEAPDGAFDFVISIEVLEHVGDVMTAVREIVRVFKPAALWQPATKKDRKTMYRQKSRSHPWQACARPTKSNAVFVANQLFLARG